MSITTKWAADADGAARVLEANSPMLLDDPAVVWIVESGNADVFAVHVDGGEAVGSRSYVCSVGPGAALFGIDRQASESELGLLAVGSVGTQVARTAPSSLAAHAHDPAELASIVQIVEEWVAGLASGAVAAAPPQTDLQLAEDSTYELRDGQSARPGEGIVWVTVKAGDLLFLGTDGIPAGSKEAPFPLAETAWTKANGPVTLATVLTAEALADDAAWGGLANYHGLILQALSRRLQERTAADANRLRREIEHNAAVREHALAELSGLLGPVNLPETPTLEPDQLFAVCHLVFASHGLPAIRPMYRGPAGGRDPLAEIAKASRVRLRRVTLDRDWWRSDSGSLIGYADNDGRPLALLSIGPGRYELVDPAGGSRTRVDGQSARQVANDAWQVYRPFPDRPIGVRNLLALGLSGCRGDLGRVAVMGIATGFLALLPPLATGAVFGTIIPNSEEGRLLAVAIGLVLAAIAIALFQVTQSVAITRIEARIDASLEPALWDRLLRLPAGFFRDYSAGNLASRAMAIDTARQILTGAALTSILASVFSIFSFALMFVYSVRLAVIAAIFTIVGFLVTVVATMIQLRHQRRLTAAQTNISGMVLQFLTGIAKLRVAGAEDRAYGKWASLFAQQQKHAIKSQETANALSVFVSAWPVFGTVAIFAFVNESGTAIISTANLLAFLVAFNQFMLAALLTSTVVSSVLQCVPLYELTLPILKALPEVDTARADPGELSGVIEISHVSFRYKSDTPLVLRDVSLQIEAGEFVALVGPSGAGKSSLIRLMLGFDTPEIGTIYFDGRDIAGLDVEAMRRQMGVVTQDSKILPGSILSNILGASLLTIEDAWDAAELAAIADDIRAMPMGMQTMISEGGTTFSGGQLQRLMIARAIVRKPRILLFDEATSALDNVSQATVTQSLDQLQATRIVIAHRLSTVENADRIFVFEAGRIVQSGTYQELMSEPGPFAEQAQRQLA